MEIESEIREAESILEALGWCRDEERYDILLNMAKQILMPYWKRSNPRALWIKAGMPNLGEDKISLSDSEFDTHYYELIRLAAEGGCPEAQYRHGCNLYDEGKIKEAVSFYFSAANEDYAPAQWCYGLDVLHGNGVEKDEGVALTYIKMAAHQRYEYAVKFMIDAYENCRYGFKENESELKKWKNILKFCECPC